MPLEHRNLLDDRLDSKISQQKDRNRQDLEEWKMPHAPNFQKPSEEIGMKKHEFICDEDNGGTLRIKTMKFFSPNKGPKDNFIDRLIAVRDSMQMEEELQRLAEMPNHYLAELERKKNKKKAKRGDNDPPPATDAKGAFGRGAQTAEGGRRSSLAG